MRRRNDKLQVRLLCGAALAGLLMTAAPAFAQDARINIAAQPLADGLNDFARQSGRPVMFTPEITGARVTHGVSDATNPELALNTLLDGTGLTWRRSGDTFLIVSASDPQSGSAAGDGADQGTVAALIVTAQKKEEAIQDVPIAISAFTEKTLEEQKIEGGFDLLKAIPNVTFSKNNFTSYNFSIRGIGTKAVSATTDPGVAVSFNNSGLIVNRLFEQEYFDVERVEVLRGPQGTLYGRNATAGVINVISAKPDMTEFKGWIKGEVGNYHAKRISAMVNLPLVDDKLAVRIAGALTQRNGYGYNAVTKHSIDGRDLWSGRVTVAFKPVDALRANLIWERFNEDDDRARTSKQLCHTDPGLLTVPGVGPIEPLASAFLSQGCKAGSLYDPGAFGAPNGDSLPFIQGSKGFGYHVIDDLKDPYGGLAQSHDLREISSRLDPIYQAHADLVELNLDWDVTPNLTLSSQTLYDKDSVYSTQDFNRFNTQPIFSDEICKGQGNCPSDPAAPPDAPPFVDGHYLNDPQLGSSDTLVTQDVSKGKAEQFSQELRLQSNFDGPVNFSLGANYVRFRTLIDYYVFSNAIDLIAFNGFLSGSTDPNAQYGSYVDPNPLASVNGYGQNYFRSQNPYKLKSASAFGEVYWKPTDDLKVTAGLRYTDDRKTFGLWPTVLLNNRLSSYKYAGDIKQHWGEFSGRLGVDWTPDLSFTDQTMLYAFYSRGYKAGGANPPNMAPVEGGGLTRPLDVPPNAVHPATFNPEFVDAFEVGAKNTLLGGALIFNTDAFFYNYKDYQVSQIVDRLALNDNFDAKTWGLEFETLFSPTRNLRINANLGYLDTRINDGQSSVDVMNRTQGHDDWVVLKNWIQYPSNCIVPVSFLSQAIPWGRIFNGNAASPGFLDRSALIGFFDSPCEGMYAPGHGIFLHYSDISGIVYNPYDHTLYPDTNNGAGFAQQLGGNELPNAPHWTMNVGAQYGFEIAQGWRATIRGDAYWQSQSWARVYNAVNDKLHGWYNANLSVWVENDDGLKIELYAKNVLDGVPITDAFLNSDDTGLTTNVFTLDPRLIGLSIKKEF